MPRKDNQLKTTGATRVIGAWGQPNRRLGDAGRFAGTSETMLAWERYLTGSALTGTPVASQIVASWQRSLQTGVDPTGRAAPLIASGDAIAELRWRHRDILLAARGLFTDADMLAGTRSIMLLTNPEGIVLDVAGDRQTMEQGQDIHLMPGGDWREAVIGTNGIGTALITGAPAQIHAAEHFCEGIKRWTCAAAPIFESGTGTLLGVIDISGPPPTYQRTNLTLAVIAARQIERTLAERVARERARLLEVCLQQLSRSDAMGLIAIDRYGRLIYSSGRLPLPLMIGERLPGFNADSAIENWLHRLPGGLRPEWYHPVMVDGATIGAMFIIPGPTRSSGTRVAEMSSEADPARCDFKHVIGSSPAIQSAIDRGRQLAAKRVPVLIEGDTGVGKELFARAIHGEENKLQPFIAFNCGAASKDLIAGELFGHVRGAFTGATVEGRPGRFELAHGGTLCLDEIGELPLELQPVLLRVLEEGVIYRLGDSRPRRVDVRLLAMTNRNLQEDIGAGRFRPDLYYRISVTRLKIPPLRARQGDIEILLEHFNQQLAQRHQMAALHFRPEAIAALRGYSWPGNVRELRNVVVNLLLSAKARDITLDDLPEEILAQAATPLCPDRQHSEPAGAPSLDDAERVAIARAVAQFHGNLAAAARSLGISRSTLYRKVERYHLLT
jgi:sigma-54 dependent transcriptional regulator, acetoin dehydrogenase operon transcriptional activator AcoR